MTLLGANAPAHDRVAEGVIDEVIFYGDMSYYDVMLEGDGFQGQHEIRISMRNVFGRELPDLGTRARVGWSPGSLILFR